MRANHQSDRLTYWSAGGTILVKGQPLGRTDESALTRARDLADFYRREALNCARKGDQEGARYCAQLAEELLYAIRVTESFRRAGVTCARAS